MQSLFINLLMLSSLNSFSSAYTSSAWGILKANLLKNPSAIGTYCSSNKRFDHIFHMTKLENLKGILKSGQILPRARVDYLPQQLFKDCDCNPDVVYASFQQKQVREGKCIFRFPVSCLEDYLEEEEKIDQIFISGFYNLGNYDPNFSSLVGDVNRFCSLLTLPGHELVIPSALNFGSKMALISFPENSEDIKKLLDDYGYQYTFKQDDNEGQIVFILN